MRILPRSMAAIAPRIVVTAIPVTMLIAYATNPVPMAQRHDTVIDTAAIAPSPTSIGVADSHLYNLSPDEIATTLDALQSIGVRNVRVFVPWAYVETSRGTYDWDEIDHIVNAAAARNMGILAEINATPAWAGGAGNGAPNDPADFGSFAAQVAARYGTDISAYEVWNEPNAAMFYNPIDPAGYTTLLKAAYPAIKAVNPDATVVAGALGSVISFFGLTLDPVTFVRQMYAAGAGDYFDALSFHPYQESLKFSLGLDVPNSPINQLNAIHDLLVANGDADKLVWITESGLPTSNVSQQTQADFVSDILSTWRTISYAGPVFIYNARDIASGSTNPDDNYGIFQTNWTPKLLAAVIRQFALDPTLPGVVLPDSAATPNANPFLTLANQLTQTLLPLISGTYFSALSSVFASSLLNNVTGLFASLQNTAGALSTALSSITSPVTGGGVQRAATAPVAARSSEAPMADTAASDAAGTHHDTLPSSGAEVASTASPVSAAVPAPESKAVQATGPTATPTPARAAAPTAAVPSTDTAPATETTETTPTGHSTSPATASPPKETTTTTTPAAAAASAASHTATGPSESSGPSGPSGPSASGDKDAAS